nr:hypothetical protein [uncultured Albidiferax sp.]
MSKILKYIDTHHEKLGVGLFIVPVFLAVFGIAGVVQLFCSLLP